MVEVAMEILMNIMLLLPKQMMLIWQWTLPLPVTTMTVVVIMDMDSAKGHMAGAAIDSLGHWCYLCS